VTEDPYSALGAAMDATDGWLGGCTSKYCHIFCCFPFIFSIPFLK